MGLSVTLANALSGMRIGNASLDVLSHNVANAGEACVTCCFFLFFL